MVSETCAMKFFIFNLVDSKHQDRILFWSPSRLKHSLGVNFKSRKPIKINQLNLEISQAIKPLLLFPPKPSTMLNNLINSLPTHHLFIQSSPHTCKDRFKPPTRHFTPYCNCDKDLSVRNGNFQIRTSTWYLVLVSFSRRGNGFLADIPADGMLYDATTEMGNYCLT